MKLLQILALTSLNLLVSAATTWAQQPETCLKLERWKPTQSELQQILSEHERWTKLWIEDAEKTTDSRDLPKSAKLPGRAILCNADLENIELTGINLAGAQLRSANLAGADLTNADLRWAELIGTNLDGARLIAAKLSNADLQGARLNRALLGPNLRNEAGSVTERRSGARLNGANLMSAQLSGADLRATDLREAILFRADLNGADLFFAILDNADLSEARLQRANLTEASVAGALLANADLTRAIYAPVSAAPDSFLGGIRGLETVSFPAGMETGLVQLRELVQKAGLRELDRQAMYAIESNKTLNAFFASSNLGSALEAFFRWLAFDLTTRYGLYPARALKIIVVLWLLFAVAYFCAIRFPAKGKTGAGIYQVWPSERIETDGVNASLSQSSSVARLQREPLPALGYAAYFSLLSAFHIGWRDLNVGAWIARIQPREYALRATGWVRTVSGVQSLMSLYLLALWALTSFSQLLHWPV
jgi:uncharacterized protein YjbI with pentapeptide repeats